MSGPFTGVFGDEYYNCDCCDEDFYEGVWKHQPSVISDEGDFCEECQTEAHKV